MRWWLVASLVLNAALAAVLVIPAGEAPTRAHTPNPATMAEPAGTAATTREMVDSGAGWTVLRHDDLKVFATNLRAAGLSDRLVRAIITAEIDDRFQGREAALARRRSERPYWRYDASPEPLEAKLARLDLKREKAGLRLVVLGADPTPDDGSGLPPEKREMARMIVEDYEALVSEITPEAGAILLPSERRMLEQLQADQRRDLETLLTPDELTEYLARNSRTGETMRQAFRGFDLSEAEFRAVFEARREFEARLKLAQFDMMNPDSRNAMSDAHSDHIAAIRNALGEERYRRYERESNPVLQQLRDLAARVGTPQAAAEQVFDLRATMSAEAKRIGKDYSQSIEARKAALAELGRTTTTEIQGLLGNEAAAAYLQTMKESFDALARGYVVELMTGGRSIRSLSR